MKTITLFFSALFMSLSIYPNGGPVIAHSSVSGVSDPIFRSMPNVNLISEKLYLTLDGAYSHIYVKYLLRNNTEEDYNKIDYAFPVDYVKGQEGENGNVQYGYHWRDSYVKDLEFKQDGKELQFKQSADEAHEVQGWFYKGGTHRRWFYTQVDIPRKSSVTLEVKYSLQNRFLEEGASPGTLNFWGYSTLNYDFSPASHWGDGKISDFIVKIDFRDPHLVSEDFHIDKNLEDAEGRKMNTLDFVQNGNTYFYQARDFNLKQAAPLQISYSYSPPLEDILSRRIDNSEYTLKVSSQRSKYPATNLCDIDLKTAWVPQKSTGEWLECTFKKPIMLVGFSLVNSYQKNETTYKQNNRIKKIKVDIKREGIKEWISSEYDNKDYPYGLNLLKSLSFVDFYDYDGLFEGESVAVEKIRFSILEVYLGAKYNDTCISELFLMK